MPLYSHSRWQGSRVALLRAGLCQCWSSQRHSQLLIQNVRTRELGLKTPLALAQRHTFLFEQ